jgi:glycine amidinotransferase
MPASSASCPVNLHNVWDPGWLSMNVLMLDQRRVVVERSQPSMIAALKGWGFGPIPCEFQDYATFGGAFHCATLDIRRRGELQSYFD